MSNERINLNSELYSNELFEYWANRKNLIPAEKHLVNKYLTNTTKNIIEAGTGGGRISFQVEEMGFDDITAFDIVPEMINHAKLLAKNIESNIEFKVADASKLSEFKTNTYDYLIYFQQVLCFIDKYDFFLASLKEAHRIAKKDSIIIFSFLDFDSRFYNSTLSFILNILRMIRREDILKQYLPWLKINNKINWKFFNKNQPVIYWVKKNTIINELKNIGFSIIEVKNANQLIKENEPPKGMLYIICKK